MNGITTSSVPASLIEYNDPEGKYFTAVSGNKFVGDFCGYLSLTNILILFTLVSKYSLCKSVYILYDSILNSFNYPVAKEDLSNNINNFGTYIVCVSLLKNLTYPCLLVAASVASEN